MLPGDAPGRTAYAPRGVWVVTEVLAAGVLVAVAPGLDRPGRVLAALAGAALLALAARDTVQRPVLEVTAAGLLLWSGVRRRLVPWADVAAVRLRAERHWSSTGAVLELDLAADDGHVDLVVLPGRRLGADPETVAALLSGLR